MTATHNDETADPTNIVIFGAAGDLTKRKLMPALIRMLEYGLLHNESRIIGVVNNRTEQVWLDLIR
ncbi:MAG: glucose-6-phosphate dehydrogenase, partial [Gammaproteobacteria bacterium]